jgi:hypothetical protein
MEPPGPGAAPLHVLIALTIAGALAGASGGYLAVGHLEAIGPLCGGMAGLVAAVVQGKKQIDPRP